MKKPIVKIKRSSLGTNIVIRSPFSRVWMFNITLAPKRELEISTTLPYILAKGAMAYVLVAIAILFFMGCGASPMESMEQGQNGDGVEWYTDITPKSLANKTNPWVSIENDRGREYVLYTSDYEIKRATVVAKVGGKYVEVDFADSDGEAENSDWVVFDLADLPKGWESIRISIVAYTEAENAVKGDF